MNCKLLPLILITVFFVSLSSANASQDSVVDKLDNAANTLNEIADNLTTASDNLGVIKDELEVTCENYCFQVMGDSKGVCTYQNERRMKRQNLIDADARIGLYPDVQTCLNTCKTFPVSSADGDIVSGDNLQCRIDHAILAQGDEGPEKHCPHASQNGGGVCVDRSPCEAYCVFYYDRVGEGECSVVKQWGGKFNRGVMPNDFNFKPSKACMNACANFAGAGETWEMSGDSANCRQQYYLMAHRRIGDTLSDTKQRNILCSNAHPYESKMCQGYAFGDYYKTTKPSVCKELCFNDKLTCGSQYGDAKQCLETCRGLPIGERQAVEGNSAQCRLTWMQYAFFQDDDETRQQFCDFGAQQSVVCNDVVSGQTEQSSNKPSFQQIQEIKKHIKMGH